MRAWTPHRPNRQGSADTHSGETLLRESKSTRLIIVVLIVALGGFAAHDLSTLGKSLPWRTMYDFPDFYCAGRALDQGANPYTYEPLHKCERAVNRNGAFRSASFSADPSLAVPAPLPAYDFLPLAALAHFSVMRATAIDAGAIILAVLLTAFVLVSLGLPLTLVAATLALSTGYMELNTGQVIPFALLALSLCGVAVARGHYHLAGVLAGLTAIEPILGLPVVLTVMLFVPQARMGAAICCAFLAFVAFHVLGTAQIVQYVTAVLPAQSAAEVHFAFQYSLTYFLARLGVPPAPAELAGGASYIVAMVMCLTVAPRCSRFLARPELTVFIPGLCCIVAGTYVHPEELCFAIPALSVLAYSTHGSVRTTFTLALCTLSVPWILVWGTKQIFLASIFVCAVILIQLCANWRIAVFLLCMFTAMMYAFELHPPSLPTVQRGAIAYAPGSIVQEEWQRYAEQRTSSDPLWFAIKLPTWAALTSSLVALAALRRRRDYSVSTG